MPTFAIIGQSTLRTLREAVPSRLDVYKAAPSFSGLVGHRLLPTTLEIPETPPEMNPADDAESAERLHRFLPQLTPRQAADERLWSTLTHGMFWTYTQRRWPDATSPTYVLDHWFVAGAGLAALRRNSVSRLWWAAHLTCAPWEEDSSLAVFRNADRYHYTRILLGSQQIFQDTLEREYGSNPTIRMALLHALNAIGNGTPKDTVTKSVVKRLQLLLQHQRLDVLKPTQVLEKCRSLTEAAAAEES